MHTTQNNQKLQRALLPYRQARDLYQLQQCTCREDLVTIAKTIIVKEKLEPEDEAFIVRHLDAARQY